MIPVDRRGVAFGPVVYIALGLVFFTAVAIAMEMGFGILGKQIARADAQELENLRSNVETQCSKALTVSGSSGVKPMDYEVEFEKLKELEWDSQQDVFTADFGEGSWRSRKVSNCAVELKSGFGKGRWRVTVKVSDYGEPEITVTGAQIS